ncbi:hypothetical protein PC116_g31065 [Phytophthora cactorum]|nr:hypothetical protein PC116_g31065 [Phytophthora cactorum]
MFGENGDAAAEVMVDSFWEAKGIVGGDCPVSSLVIAKPVGSFKDPLAFLFLAVGPEGLVGEPCLDITRDGATGTDWELLP